MGARRQWFIDILGGIVVGGLLSAIAAVNFVIYIGIERGYEASIADVFRQNWLAGIATVGILIAGPLTGVFLMRRRRRRSQEHRLDSDPG